MKKIEIEGSGAPPDKCWKTPPLDGVYKGNFYNPMIHCTFKPGHNGKHSWEK